MHAVVEFTHLVKLTKDKYAVSLKEIQTVMLKGKATKVADPTLYPIYVSVRRFSSVAGFPQSAGNPTSSHQRSDLDSSLIGLAASYFTSRSPYNVGI